MNSDNEENNFLSIFEEDIKKQLEIVKLLNSLFEASYKDYYNELTIAENKYLFIFPKVQNKLKYLEQTAIENEENIEPLFAITVFKVLFMKQKFFNLDDFDNKKKYFNIILNILTNISIKEESTDLDHLTDMILNSEFSALTKRIDLKNKSELLFPYCLYIIHL